MKAQTKAGYETPEIFVVNLIIDNELLQSSLSTEGLEDTTPEEGSWR